MLEGKHRVPWDKLKVDGRELLDERCDTRATLKPVRPHSLLCAKLDKADLEKQRHN